MSEQKMSRKVQNVIFEECVSGAGNRGHIIPLADVMKVIDDHSLIKDVHLFNNSEFGYDYLNEKFLAKTNHIVVNLNITSENTTSFPILMGCDFSQKDYKDHTVFNYDSIRDKNYDAHLIFKFDKDHDKENCQSYFKIYNRYNDDRYHRPFEVGSLDGAVIILDEHSNIIYNAAVNNIPIYFETYACA